MDEALEAAQVHEGAERAQAGHLARGHLAGLEIGEQGVGVIVLTGEALGQDQPAAAPVDLGDADGRRIADARRRARPARCSGDCPGTGACR